MFFVLLICILVLKFIALLISLKVYCKLTYGINKCSKHLVGKVVIVTGGNAGIGFETAKDLAARGARVIIACRDEARGTTARDQIVTATGNKDVLFKKLDLASFASIRTFADELNQTEKKIDILINNAGVMESKHVKSEDGLCLGMQINHFGPFLLTNLLLPLLKLAAPSRIINVSSMAYRYGKIDFDNLNLEKETEKSYSLMKLYSNTKLCNVLMTVELSRLLVGTRVTVNCLHPGAVRTSIMDKVINEKPWIKFLATKQNLSLLLSRTPWEGAQTSIYLAVSPDVSSVSGKYFAECKEETLSKDASDAGVARKLWEVSERLVQLT